MNKTVDDMNAAELRQHIKTLESESHGTEWQGEFTRQEIKEARAMLRELEAAR